MDWLDLLILALRIVLVALLYLFLLLVMRAARRGLLAPVSNTNTSRSEPRHRLRLVVIEAGTSDLTPGQLIEVHDGGTLGRAQRADLVLGDVTVSAEQARVNRVGRAWVVKDLGSTNGTLVNTTRVSGSVPLAEGDVLGLGGVRLRVAGH